MKFILFPIFIFIGFNAFSADKFDKISDKDDFLEIVEGTTLVLSLIHI